MIQVVLTMTEFHIAAYTGFAKGLRVIARGRRGDMGYSNAFWQDEVDGEVGAYAVCRTFGWPWYPSAEPDKKTGDTVDARGNRYEIRTTRRRDGNLLVYENDPDEHWAILVRGGPLVLWIVGTILVGEAKQRRWWRGDWERPCYLVPAEELLPMVGQEKAS